MPYFYAMKHFPFLAGICLLSHIATAQSYDLAISEIQYNADSSLQSQDWVELYNYGSDAIDISGWVLKTENVLEQWEIPGGTVIQPGQYKVLVQWIDTFLMVHPDVTNYVGEFEFGFDNGGGTIRLIDDGGSPAVQITYSDSLPWPMAADGYGPTLEIINPEDEPNDPNNWFAGCNSGSPGEAYDDCNYAIQLSEINYNSAPFHNSGDWIELVNSSATAVNIGNWKIRDSKDSNQYKIPAGTILDPGERLVVSDSLAGFNTYFPSVENVIGELPFGFSRAGEAIRISNEDMVLQYSVFYLDSIPWYVETDGDGYTLELLDFYGTPNVPEAWTPGCQYGSPGTEIILPCPTAVDDYSSLPFTAGPNPFNDGLVFQFQPSNSNSKTHISIYNMQGQLLQQASTTMNSYTLPTGSLPAGLYLAVVQHAFGRYSIEVVKE
jgi:hypothetical protein